MHTPDLFLIRAAECETMAKIAREPDSRAVWTRMAERWQRCAQVEANAISTAHRDGDANRHRKQAPSWSRH
jgi:hypothetical protein